MTIGDGAQAGAQAGVMNDIPAGLQVLGSPAADIKEKVKQFVVERKLPQMHKQLKQLAKRIEAIEASKNNS